MKKRIIGITVGVLLILSVSVCFAMAFREEPKSDSAYFQNIADENVKLSMSFNGVADSEEYESISAYVKSVADVPDNYNRIAKLKLHVNNQSRTPFYGFKSEINNGNIFMVPECVKREFTDTFEPNSAFNVDVYVFLNDELKDEAEIINALKETNFEFTFFVNNSESMNPYEVLMKAQWENTKQSA